MFNPVTQGERFDPDGEYVRRWVPELTAVPSARIHRPWTMTRDDQQAAGVTIGVDLPWADHRPWRGTAVRDRQAFASDDGDGQAGGMSSTRIDPVALATTDGPTS
jgi:deoxyribodipyrimidine photo-lyase